jgi:NTP pyrophosphatase (non-canonical NTP hydrolase)
MCTGKEKIIKLPRLDLLAPSMDSTLLKIMEEAGELARAVLLFEDNKTDANLLSVAEELLDVAQTCVTMIFVLEDSYDINPGEMIGSHLKKLKRKGYPFNLAVKYYIQSTDHYKYLLLPKLDLPDVTLLKTVCKIQEEVGELAQVLGKKARKSGENLLQFVTMRTLLHQSALELLDIAQCCFTMLYLLEGQYRLEIGQLLEKHYAKLIEKGYCE